MGNGARRKLKGKELLQNHIALENEDYQKHKKNVTEREILSTEVVHVTGRGEEHYRNSYQITD